MSKFEKKIINQWEIKITIEKDSIIFKLKDNFFNIYCTSFQFKYLLNFALFSTNDTIDKIGKFILMCIDEKRIKINKKEKSVELVIISNKNNIPNVKLIINEKDKKIKKKIILDKITIKNQEKQNKKENKLHNKNNIIINNLKQINSIDNYIISLYVFPSGNIISILFDKSIKIYDNYFNIIQTIPNGHNDYITYVNIKNEDNFVTYSLKNIKTWIKIKEKFKEEYSLNKIINNAHEDWINKVIYNKNLNLISCSDDKSIKIWEEDNNNNYQCITVLRHDDEIYSILLLEDKNILISSGLDGTKFWNLNNYENIFHIKQVICLCNNALNRIDNERIIIGGNIDGIIKIISIKEKTIVKEIKNEFPCLGICIINEKGLFLIGGKSKNIKIYRYDNYECIQIINDAHNDEIYGITELNDNSIVSYGYDKTIKIWSFLF